MIFKSLTSAEKNIKLGMLFSYISLFLTISISLIYTPFELRCVGQKQYGLSSFVNSITSWLTVLSSALVSSYIRFATLAASQKDSDKQIKLINTNYLFLFVIIGITILVIGVILCPILKFGILPNSIYKDDPLAQSLIILLAMISTLNICISVSANIFGLYNSWKEKFAVVKGIGLIISILQPLTTVPFLLLGFNIVCVVVIQLIYSVISIILHAIFAIKRYGFKANKNIFKIEKKIIRDILIFSFFIILTSITDQINNNVDKTLLGFMVSSESVAIYQIGMQFKSHLLIFSISISTVFTPKVASAAISDNDVRMNELFLKVSRLQIIVILFIVFGVVTCGRPFILLWLGEDYLYSFYTIAVLFLLDAIPLTENVAIEAQKAKNKHKFRAVLYIIIACLNIVLTAIFIKIFPKEHAIFGCLLGTAISTIIGKWILINIYNHKVINLNVKKYFRYFLKTLFFAALASVLTYMCVYFVKIKGEAVHFFIRFILFVCFYLTYVLLCERKFLITFFKKGGIEQL